MAPESSLQTPRAPFPLTRQSAIALLGSDDDVARVRAFDILVRAYWRPVYKHIRLRWNRPAEDGRDLTQAFFARAFEKRFFVDYDATKSRFRTYLKACLDRFVMDARRGERREKRGGGAVRLSLDFDVAEQELNQFGATAAGSLEACFDVEWTRNLFSEAVIALEAACAESGKQDYFRVFRRYVLDDEPGFSPSSSSSVAVPVARPSYATLAAELGLTVSDVTNYLSWTRREFRRWVLVKLRDITATDEEFQEEARALFGTGP